MRNKSQQVDFFIKKVKGMALLGKETNHDQTDIQQHYLGDKEQQ